MPTTHIEPSSSELLQKVADALLKSRKVIVITGAGISTNSGIPDFRSENGLYSLIQAQYDAFARQAEQKAVNESEPETDSDTNVEARPVKRPRTAEYTSSDSDTSTADASIEIDDIQKPSEDVQELLLPTDDASTRLVDRANHATPQSRRFNTQLPTSPLSSPLPEELLLPPSALRRSYPQLNGIAFPPSSSPLSSPPPILFDPFDPRSPSDASSTRQSTTGTSEDEDEDQDDDEDEDEDEDTHNHSQLSFMSSQTSNGGRYTLPNMKGRDLFDAQIWADPLRTSVFYTFATSLRQKIKEAEPTKSHRFISHLRDRGKLVRCYTQNIDQIEEKVGLSTSLSDGPGSRGRFSRRSTANASQLSKMVDEVTSTQNTDHCSNTHKADSESGNESSQTQTPQSQLSDGTETPKTEDESLVVNDTAKPVSRSLKRETSKSGVECVFLHGSLELLRCFLCGRVCSWEDDDREAETLSGLQPECPHCAGATAARQERGKRALGVGKLRPDIVLYGEEHPSSHLISPIVTHDLSLYPDFLLILGTSLRVHGLKIMVREFARTVHSKGGNVVFVNFTKPPDSIWGDTIDYWVQWDCDAWVTDLQERVPALWQDAEPKKPRPPKKIRPPPANPMALRDTTITGAYFTSKILKELRRVTGPKPLARRATISALSSEVEKPTKEEEPAEAENDVIVVASPTPRPFKETPVPLPKIPRSRGPRKSAPAALELPKQPQSSTLNPNHGRSRKSTTSQEPLEQLPSSPFGDSSILDSVKANPRRRKRKVIDGEEVGLICRKRAGSQGSTIDVSYQQQAYQLPPLRPNGQIFSSNRPQPLEPPSPPAGPLGSLSVNLRSSVGATRSLAAGRALNEAQLNQMKSAESGRWQSGSLPPLHPAAPLIPIPPKSLRGGNTRVGRSAMSRNNTAKTSITADVKASRSVDALQHWGSSWQCSPR